MTQRIEKTIIIKATPYTVWNALTNPDLIRQWMGEPEMEIEVITDWKEGSPIVIKGFHHVKFENKGTVLQCKPGSVLKYDYLSSLSRLPDTPENRTIIEFALSPSQEATLLTLTLSNFPDETILKHVDFYWRTTIVIMQKFIERAVVS